MKLQVVIVDQEASSRQHLRHLLRTEPTAEVVAECVTGTQALEAIRRNGPNLVFMDVTLPELDGFGVVKALEKGTSPAVVFVSAQEQFAARAFEIRAVDYVLKPCDPKRFQIALRRAIDWLQLSPTSRAESISSVAPRPDNPPFNSLDRITVKSRGRINLVKTIDIDWIGAEDNYIELHVGKASHLLRTSIRAASQHLPHGRFIRISRSRLVNSERIKEIQTRTHGDYYVILEDGTRLAGSRNYRQCLNQIRTV